MKIKSFHRLGLAALCALAISPALAANPGAIWTTLSAGQTVNSNIYFHRWDVYLNGGPNNTSGGGKLPDGDYYFQVTDPSGKVLLSQDAIQCRQVKVVGGKVTGAAGSCPHANGTADAFGGLPVQLTPFAITPNEGGEYKAWFVSVKDYKAGSCNFGFCNSSTKTDNFKVRPICVDVPNTATLVETGQSSVAKVSNCQVY